MIKSVSDNQQEILTWIRDLYCPMGFQVDATYSKGAFYIDRPDLEPFLKFDREPQSDDVCEADCRNLPLEDGSIKSLVFDPPFITFVGKESQIGNRFGGEIRSQLQIRALYMSAMVEFYRVLSIDGVLVFKCQDVQLHGQVMNHCHVWDMATRLGYSVLDLFILVADVRMVGHNHQVQHCARKFHSYFWVFGRGRRP
jgi:hypothetical protein